MQNGFPNTVKANPNLSANWTHLAAWQQFHHPRKREEAPEGKLQHQVPSTVESFIYLCGLPKPLPELPCREESGDLGPVLHGGQALALGQLLGGGQVDALALLGPALVAALRRCRLLRRLLRRLLLALRVRGRPGFPCLLGLLGWEGLLHRGTRLGLSYFVVRATGGIFIRSGGGRRAGA